MAYVCLGVSVSSEGLTKTSTPCSQLPVNTQIPTDWFSQRPSAWKLAVHGQETCENPSPVRMGQCRHCVSEDAEDVETDEHPARLPGETRDSS